MTRNARSLRCESRASAPVRTAGAALFALSVSFCGAGSLAAQLDDQCPSGRITELLIENGSVFDRNETEEGGRLRWAYRLANGLHMRTQPEVIERELLFTVGSCYDQELIADSERLLRAFDFLADANITAYPLLTGDVRVVVATQDEWSTRIEPRVASSGSVGLQGLRLVEDNVMGTGRHLGLFYERQEGERIYGGSYSTPHLFDSRWNLDLRVAQTEFGYSYHEGIAYPFVGERGRVGFRQGIDREDRFFEVLMPSTDGHLSRIFVPVSRTQYELGAAFRWGSERYRHTLLGAALAAERVDYPENPRLADDPGDDELPRSVVSSMSWNPVSSVRLMLLSGQRNVYFVRRRGIDTINGSEDVQLGVEAEGSFGPTLPGISEDKDIAIGLRVSAAGELMGSILSGADFTFEGRRAYESLEGLPEWHDVLTELDLWAYVRPRPESHHTFVVTASALGGWHSRIPFQLTLGGDAGLRGYPRHVYPGGRRVVASIEHRAFLGWPMPELFDLGTVAFVDFGKIWPGHAPFAVESPLRASVGAGIRAAFPPGSRQTLRVDLGIPLDAAVNFDNVTVSIGVGQAIGRRATRRDPQLLRSARYNLSTNDFEHAALAP